MIVRSHDESLAVFTPGHTFSSTDKLYHRDYLVGITCSLLNPSIYLLEKREDQVFTAKPKEGFTMIIK